MVKLLIVSIVLFTAFLSRAATFNSAATALEGVKELSVLLREADGRPVVLNFWTETCGYCHVMMPSFRQHAAEYQDRAYFRTVNIREQPEIAKKFGVDGLPNFKFIHRKKVVDNMRGASLEGLAAKISKVVHKADKEEVAVQKDDLVEFFSRHDPEISSSEESIDMLIEQGGADWPRLLDMLESQYGSKPRYSGGFIQRAALLPAAAAAAVDGGAETCASRPASASGLSTAELEKELSRRRAEAIAAPRIIAANPCSLFRSRNPNAVERVVILGGGPAGMSAAIYASRSALCPIIVSPPLGGQLALKGVGVENYPGIARTMGREIIESMQAQAESFHAAVLADSVLDIDLSTRPFKLTTNASGVLRAEAIIVATGSDSRWLGVPGEVDLRGHGVSSCAACDGYLHRDEACVVVGGGDSAVEDALMLSRICTTVTLVHRRGELRAGRVLRDRLAESSIAVLWHKEVAAFESKAGRLAVVRLRDLRSPSDALVALPADAAFVAIGHTPNTAFLQGQLAMQGNGYLESRGHSTATSVPGVFAAGDVSDPIYRQAVTSAGSGAQAAIDAERWLSEQPVAEAPRDPRVRPEDFAAWSVDEVRDLALRQLGLNCEGCTGKSDFAVAVRRSWL